MARKTGEQKCVLDEEDLKDITEAKADIKAGRFYTTEEIRGLRK